MKRTIFFCALLALFTGANAQKTTDYKEKHPYKDWVKLAPKLDDAFFTTPEAVRIADNVLLYQQTTGGTTIDAVAMLEKHGFRSSIFEAVQACAEKAKIL